MLWLTILAVGANGNVPPVGNVFRRGTFGPIGTGSTAGIAGGSIACDSAPVSSFFADLKPPFPTNSWWAPYAAPPGNETAAGPYPYQSLLDGYGVQFGVSASRQFDGTSVKQPTQSDLRASFAEHDGAFEKHKATSFDTQSVTVRYFAGAATMDAYLVPGAPYMTFEYTSATPVFKAVNGIASFGGHDLGGSSVNATGTSFSVTDSKGVTYRIYASSSITLGASNDNIVASEKYNGVLRFAKLIDPSHQHLLDKHSATYPTSVGLDYSFTDVQGTLVFTWNTVGTGDLLMLTWPHHRLKMKNANFPPTSSLAYLTTKGWMYPALGNSWSMSYDLPGITWNPPRDLDESCSSAVIQGLEYEVGQLNASTAPVPGDFYYWGGALAATARLALIADHLGRQDLIQPVVEYLKASFEHWFQASSLTVPAYETGWGGVINKAGANNAYVDFGNGYYNDHHFHYGYFLNIAAVIAKFDSSWLAQHRDYINWFARDIINPSSQDPYFPITRCRDWFAGHSWASGIANGAGSRDQESSGEAVNGYYGALLWASVALSQDFVNYAKLLLATEQHASQVYWHLYPQQGENDGDNPYPESEMRKLVTMGNVEDWQAGAWLFWGSQRVEIAAIQILPLTPANEGLYDAQWAQNVWDYTASELDDTAIGDEWKCVIIAAYAGVNPQEAAKRSSELSTWGSGNTYTNELFFIGTRDNTGSPICGSMPSNPYDSFTIQEASSGKYITANTSLGTSATSVDVFTSAYLPNAGTLQLASTKMYVTADQGGKEALSATRAAASAWESFVIRPKAGAEPGVYTIKAASNGEYVTVTGDGALVNNADEAAGAGFRFVKH